MSIIPKKEAIMDINFILNKTKKYVSKRARKHKLKSFYVGQIKEGKTLVARELDRLFLSLIVFIGVLFFLIIQFRNFYISMIISSIIAISIYIGVRIKNIKEIEKAKELVKKNVAEDMVYNELVNKSPEDFIDYFINVFNELNFENVLKSNSKDYNIELHKDNQILGVKILQYTQGYDVNGEIVREFFMDLRRNNFNEGIILTTTDFTDEVNDLINKINKHMKIHLINMKDIMDILRQTSKYPKDKDIEIYILNKIKKERKNISQYSNSIFAPAKWKKYFLSGLALWIFGQFTDFYIYYLLISIILFSLGLVSLIKKIIMSINNYKKEDEKNYAYDFIYKK